MTITLFVDNDMDIVENQFRYAQSGAARIDVDMYFTLALKATTGAVEGATNDTPIVIESTAHGLVTGQQVVLFEVGGNTAARGTFAITVIDPNHFSLDASVGNGAWTSGGTWHLAVESAAAIAMPYSVDYLEYRGVLSGAVPLLLTPATYILVKYALGDYRDKWKKVHERVTVKRRQ